MVTSGYMDKRVLHDTTEGTPQGGIISPALANCALDGLERLLKEEYPTGTRLKSVGGEKPCVNLIRYADDFVITGRTKELLEEEVKPLVEQFLQERGLELSSTKRSYARDKRFRLPSDKTCADTLAGNCSSSPPRKHQGVPGWHSKNDQSRAWHVCRRFD